MKKRPYHLCAAAIITSVIAFPVQSVMMVPWTNYDSLTKELRNCDEIQAFKQHIEMLKGMPLENCFLSHMGATTKDIPRNKELFDTYGPALCKPGFEACEEKLEEALSNCSLPEKVQDDYIKLYKAAETKAQDIVVEWFKNLKITEEQRKEKNFCRDGQCATLLYTLDPKEYSGGSIRNFGGGPYDQACRKGGKDPIYTTLSVNRYFKCSD